MIKNIIKIMIFVPLLIGCKKFEIVESSDNKSDVELKINYKWNCSKGEKPDEAYLFISRLQNTYHTYFVTDTNGVFLDEQPYSEKDNLGVKAEDDGNEQIPDDVVPIKAEVPGGEYSMVAVGLFESKNVKPLHIPNREQFILDFKNVGMTDLVLEYNPLPEDGMPELNGAKWINQYPGYKIINNVGRVFSGKVVNANLTTGSPVASVNIPMTALTMRIQLNFDVQILSGKECEATIETNEVIVEQSGVFSAINIIDKTVNVENMSRMFYKGNLKVDGNNKNLYHYSGIIDAPAIMPGGNTEVVSGPGVIRLGIKLQLLEKKTNRKIPFLLKSVVNISKEISKAELTLPTSTEGVRKQAKSTGNIKIERNLTISPDELLDKQNGFENWIDIDIDKEI